MKMKFVKATSDDVALLVTLRMQQLIDEQLPTEPNIEKQLTEFFTKQLATDLFIQWLLLSDTEEVMATGAILFYQFPPSQYNPSGIRGYIANMYTIKQYRGHGYASQVLDQLVQEAKQRNVHKLFLYGSEMGQPVYKKYGFKFVDAYMEYEIET
jgi:GNAT superfamily N-acetyltransferase